ncbi:MAG: biopolymer transporter ExbD [Bacteroidales bacterium]|jgi:biopolymer transport protein ExbD|nr:biopolymer transporter ExbD [Bacteroidales bacterium]
MAIKQRNKINAAFSMSSMTDVVFLLLIFFLVTSTLINPNALKLLLPKSTNQISAKPQVSVSIKHYQETNTFSYHINGLKQETPFEQVEVSIQALLQNTDEPTFTILADQTVPIEKVVELMNIAKRNQYKVILATAPE